MADRLIIAADRNRLRIYRFAKAPGQFTASIQPVDAMDLVDSDARLNATPLSVWRESMDTRAEELRAERARRVALLSARIAEFLAENPGPTWDFAAAATLRDEVLELLPEPARRRMDRVIAKDLVTAPPAELREHFALR